MSSEPDAPAPADLSSAIDGWLRLRAQARRVVQRLEPDAADPTPGPDALAAFLSLLARSRESPGRVTPPRRIELPDQANEVDLSADSPSIDLAVLHGPSARQRRWLDALLPSVAVGGYIVATGVFAGGRSVDYDAADADSAEARQLRSFPGYFLSHPQLESTILPLADGLAVGVKLRSLVTERGGPF